LAWLGAAANKECIGKCDHPPHHAIGRAEAKWLSKMRGAIGYQSERKERFPLPNFFAPTQGNSCDELLEPGAKPLITVKVISY
jgi:hypothetical protein